MTVDQGEYRGKQLCSQLGRSASSTAESGETSRRGRAGARILLDGRRRDSTARPIPALMQSIALAHLQPAAQAMARQNQVRNPDGSVFDAKSCAAPFYDPMGFGLRAGLSVNESVTNIRFHPFRLSMPGIRKVDSQSKFPPRRFIN